ncbi:MAG: DMT family transporter [Deltaproteobacteria bacterium]|nr:DMT family transporter [Deltaproteobacteria bacterium]
MSTRWSAALHLVAATCAFSVVGLLVKLSAERFPATELVFLRGLFGVPVLLLLARARGVSLAGRRRRLLAGRALAGTVAMFLYFVSLAWLPVGEALLLNQSNPIFALPLAALLLRERIGWRHWALVLAALAGVVLIVRPQSASLNWPALVGLASALFTALAYVQVRELTHSESSLTIVFWFTAGSMLLGGLAMIPQFVVPRWDELPALLGIGAFALLGQLSLTWAYAHGEVGRLAALGSLGAVLGALWDLLVWGHAPDAWTALGGLVAIGACAGLQLIPGPRPLTPRAPTA